jgi:hypothetical protein
VRLQRISSQVVNGGMINHQRYEVYPVKSTQELKALPWFDRTDTLLGRMVDEVCDFRVYAAEAAVTQDQAG